MTSKGKRRASGEACEQFKNLIKKYDINMSLPCLNYRFPYSPCHDDYYVGGIMLKIISHDYIQHPLENGFIIKFLNKCFNNKKFNL